MDAIPKKDANSASTTPAGPWEPCGKSGATRGAVRAGRVGAGGGVDCTGVSASELVYTREGIPTGTHHGRGCGAMKAVLPVRPWGSPAKHRR